MQGGGTKIGGEVKGREMGQRRRVGERERGDKREGGGKGRRKGRGQRRKGGEMGETKEFEEEEVFSCLYVLSGKGILKTETKEYQIERNSQFFVPAGKEKYCITNVEDEKIKILKMHGPKSE